MPNIQSAAKRARQNPKRRAANRFYRAKARNAVSRARALIEAGDPGAAAEGVQAASSALDRAARAHAVHSNLANRTKSRLARQLQAVQAAG
jgi:small subunit ribosomal protein S20